MTEQDLIKFKELSMQDGRLNLQWFAEYVAEAEREACIAIAESKRHAPNFALTSMPPQNGTAVDIANLIRARGQA